jgi:hypothetical protein
VEIITIHVIQQTQPFTQNVWPRVHVMGTIEWPPIQRNILITNMQPIIEIASTCAYYQQGHEFKNCPFVDGKVKRLMK